MERLKKRADFLKAAQGKAVRMPGFILQYRAVPDDAVRFGFTVTKRQGNAVTRNRVKRRLKEAVRLENRMQAFRPGDYVVIGRKESLGLPFPLLQEHIRQACSRAAGNTSESP